MERVNYDRILELNGFKFGIKTLSAIHGLSTSRVRAIASNRDAKRIKELCEEGNKLFAPICKMSNIEYDVHYGCKTLTELVEKYGYKNISEFCNWVGVPTNNIKYDWTKNKNKIVELIKFGLED